MYRTNSEPINSHPVAVFPTTRKSVFLDRTTIRTKKSVLVSDLRYTIRLAENQEEITELLKLRHRVFKVEIGKQSNDLTEIESDEYDSTSHHLIAVENVSGRIVGGYRLRTAEINTLDLGFYSAGEFCLNDLPDEILDQSVEIGRACIEAEYRNGKVLFLLWKGLARYVLQKKKRYLFGCCSLFSNDLSDGFKAYRQLEREGFMHENLNISALKSNFFEQQNFCSNETNIELPKLFTTYLRIGAKVCSQPILDEDFGTIDFFVIFDSLKMNEKYRKLFFG
ncbi:GNAT family N-acetyltransferase [soil metagenome]